MLHSQSLLDDRVQDELNQVQRQCICTLRIESLPAMANSELSMRTMPYSNPLPALLTAQVLLTGQEILANGA